MKNQRLSNLISQTHQLEELNLIQLSRRLADQLKISMEPLIKHR